MLLQIIGAVMGVLVLILIYWRFWFLRDPVRTIPEGNSIISPADGRIIKVIEINQDKIQINKGLLGRINTLAKDVKNAYYLVSIFMSPMDVHVQRAPVSGRIAAVTYSKGKFLAASSMRALLNEKNEILIEGLNNSIKVIQIAGFMARRIECFVNKGENVLKGQRIGRINLGSQVTLILPRNVDLKIKQGDRVRAGETIIADMM